MFHKKFNFNLNLSSNYKPSFEYTTITQNIFSRNAHQRTTNLSFDNTSLNKRKYLHQPPNHSIHNYNHKSYSLTKTYTNNFLHNTTNTPSTTISSFKKPPTKKNILTLNNANNFFTNIPTFIPVPSTTMSNKKLKQQQQSITKPTQLTNTNVSSTTATHNNINNSNSNNNSKGNIHSYGIIKNNSVGNNMMLNHSQKKGSSNINSNSNNNNQKYKTKSVSLSTSSSTKGIYNKDNNNINNTNIIHHGILLSTESTIQSTDDSRNIIPKLQKEIIYLKGKNEAQKKTYESTINKLNDELKEMKHKMGNIVQTCNKLKLEKEVLLAKEQKFMKMFYLLNQKGIDIDHIIMLVQQESDEKDKCVNSSSRSTMSLTEVKFVDRNKCNKNEGPKTKVPKLDFHLVPEYESSDDDGNNNNDVNYYEVNNCKHDIIEGYGKVKHNSSV